MENIYIQWDDEEIISSESGMKSYYLWELKKIGVKIPQGFVLSQKAFLDFIADNGIYSKIEGLLTDFPSDIPGIRDRSQRLCDLFIGVEIPHNMGREINDACNRLSSKQRFQFAVRSSSTIEDLMPAGCAGIYDTFLKVKSNEEVKKAIKRCWQSAFGLRALAYLKKLNLLSTDMNMAILVQKMINPKFAGVMFTIDPVNGDASKISIEYSSGLGDKVVSGQHTSISLLVDKITGWIENLSIVPGRFSMDYGPLTMDQNSPQSIDLEEKYIYQLGDIGKQIEKHFGCYQDIEWAIDKASDEVVILQARPETIWNRK